MSYITFIYTFIPVQIAPNLCCPDANQILFVIRGGWSKLDHLFQVLKDIHPRFTCWWMPTIAFDNQNISKFYINFA